jgi:PAS domain-containing protein
MNKSDKTKDELLLELKELKQKNIALKVMFEKDITGRNNAEESMRKSEERFRSLYENSTMGLYRTTPDGKIILANPTLVKMLGTCQ